MIDLYDSIKQAKDYQLTICAGHMIRAYRDASDNLTGTITSTMHHACNEELVKRNLKPVKS